MNHLRHLVVSPTSMLLLSKFLAFRYNTANCLIPFLTHSTLCRHILLVDLPSIICRSFLVHSTIPAAYRTTACHYPTIYDYDYDYDCDYDYDYDYHYCYHWTKVLLVDASNAFNDNNNNNNNNNNFLFIRHKIAFKYMI